jgi:HK97 gp10 family phage protein
MPFERALAAMQAEAERALSPAMVEAAALVADEARADHPYEDRTGDLTARTVPGAIVAHGDTLTVQLVGDTEYGGFVDEGTARMAARPFLRPAFDRREDDAAHTVVEHLARAIP